MSSCEKCWKDAHDGSGDAVRRYEMLSMERKQNPCTPEEQAGVSATHCPSCGRKTLHQHTSEAMCGCPTLFQGLRNQRDAVV